MGAFNRYFKCKYCREGNNTGYGFANKSCCSSCYDELNERHEVKDNEYKRFNWKKNRAKKSRKN